MRGLPQRHVPLYLNGIPVNSAADGQFDPRLIATENIAEIKIMPGVSSVLYGPGTTAGLINIITRRGAGDWHGRALVETASGTPLGGDVSVLTSASVGGRMAGTDVFVSGSAADSPGFTDADGYRTPNSDTRRTNLFANLAHGWDGVSVGLSAGYVNGEQGLPYNSINDPANLFLMPQQFERLDRIEGGFAQGDVNFDSVGPFTARLSGYVNVLNTEDNRYDDATFSSMTNTRVQSFHQLFDSAVSGGRIALGYDLAEAGHISSTLGVQRDVLKLSGFIRNISITTGGGGGGGGGGGATGTFAVRPLDIEAASTTTSAAFEYAISPLEKLHATVGASAHWFDRGAVTKEGTQLAASLAYDLTPDVTVSAGAARKVRFPTLQQLFDAQRGNVNLSAEVGKTYEATAAWAPITGVGVTASLFRTRIDGFIQNDQATQQFTNKDTLSRGIELAGHVRVSERLRFAASYTHLNTTDETTGARVNFRPTDLARIAADVDITDAWSLHGALAYGGGEIVTARSGPFQQQGLPDRTTVDLRTAYSFTGLGVKVWLASENLFNAQHENAPGVAAPGRTFIAGIQAGF